MTHSGKSTTSAAIGLGRWGFGGVPGIRDLARAARSRADMSILLLLTAIVLLSNAVHIPFLPQGLPPGIAAIGVVTGAAIALQALGLVLVLRTSRIINFALVQFGALAATLFVELDKHVQLAWAVRYLCPPCMSGVTQDPVVLQAHPTMFLTELRSLHMDWLINLNFFIALVLALAIAGALGYLTQVLLMSRLRDAPRLIATVATLAVAEFLAYVCGQIPGLFQDETGVGADPGLISTPIQLHVNVGGSLFDLGQVAVVVFAVLAFAGVFVLFRSSRIGVAIRGAAERPDRAESLGINVNRTAGIVWAVAALLSAVATLCAAITEGPQGTTLSNASLPLSVVTFAPVLAAVVFARLRSLPLAALAAVLIGIATQAFYFNLKTTHIFFGVLFIVIAATLLLQPHHLSRAEDEATAGYLGAREARPIPRQLRALPVVDSWLRWLAIAIAVVVLGVPFVLDPGQVSFMSAIFIFGIIGLSLLVLTGWAGQISLGQFAFAAAGGYVASVLGADAGLNILLCIVIAAIATTLLSVVAGIPALRLRGFHLAIVTLVFAEAVALVLLDPQLLGRWLPATLPRPFMLGLDFDDEKVFYYFCLLVLALVVVAVLGARRSAAARALIAARDNENAAQSFGISLVRARLQAFAMAGFLAGIAGALYAYHQRAVEPFAYGAENSVNLFAASVIGGLGSVAGPLLGVLYQNVFVLFPIPLLATLAVGAGLLVVILVAPGGLVSVALTIRDALLRRVALRHRVETELLVDETGRSLLAKRAVFGKKRVAGSEVAFIPRRYRLPPQWREYRGDAGG